jgi:hypothetical protein
MPKLGRRPPTGSAAYVADCAAGWVVGCMAERAWRRGDGATRYPTLCIGLGQQGRSCYSIAAVMKEFTATRPPLHTLAQAVEDARHTPRRRWSARVARAASGMSQAPACSRRITQRREGDAPRQRIDCLGVVAGVGWISKTASTRRCTIRESGIASHARNRVDCYSQTAQRVCHRALACAAGGGVGAS